jgi:hypothetical protein
MKPFTQTIIVAGKPVAAGLEDWGCFHIGYSGLEGYDATFTVAIRANEDRAALGKFLCELGAKLAPPAPKKVQAKPKATEADKILDRLISFWDGCCGLPDTSSEISWLNKIVEEARKIRK